MSNLRDRIETARERLATNSFDNEAAIRSGVVDPILNALGWDLYNPSINKPEYRVGARRVDLALFVGERPAVFVEVKQPGKAAGADRQLFEYAFMEGVPLAVLTDGATWSVHVPAEQGSMEERRAFFLDLAERSLTEGADKLTRYLARDAVASGEAFDRARRDCQRARQRRGALAAIPQAWANLVKSEDATILERLAAEVESVSGFQSEPADLVAFLATLAPASGALPKGKKSKPRTPRRQKPAPLAPEATPPAALNASALPARGFELDGRFVACKTGADVLAGVLRAFSERDPSFLERFDVATRTKKRRLLAPTPEALYPGKPEFHRQVREVTDGWLVATHSSSAAKQATIAKAVALMPRVASELKVRFQK
ncbi:hypothetical protein [Rubricoccus marinus]|uniref:Type I restriction enzyme R protein N-terminal domain-containing protein n=1 Tax=Rubricoccus marinus TaxID=716817 RepID=A0A259U0B5_9BACT|nr:hypothetical protein [Rubricoccus marinus]OZC03390.1 hypothetical protein BSZ36_10600 [Rubricoccus marinus]